MELISVIMSIYNEPLKYIKDSVESILKQTYKNIEFIIVIDNPQNNIVIEYLIKCEKKDSRIKLLYNKKNLGLAKSLNMAIESSQGKYIARMDADDISIENRLEMQKKKLEEYNLDMINSLAYRMDENGKVWSEIPPFTNESKVIMAMLPWKNVIIHPSVMIKANVIKCLNGYRNFESAQDYDLWLRMLSSGYKIGVINEKLIYFRFHGNSITSTKKFNQYINEKYIRILYKERIEKNNVDSYSEEILEEYLYNNNYYDKNYQKKVNKFLLEYRIGVKNIKEKKYICGICKITHSLLSSREVRDNIKITFASKLAQKRYS